ncbi:MAG: FAD/NAD(P)-binding protein [Catenulispora sp.]|nr:FAD/NAD(P)-binding protein [Catenulispora sp.]
MIPARYRVVANHRDTADTHTLRLAPLDEPIAGFRAGQFTMVYVFGVGEIPLSVSGSPLAGDDILVHTVRAVGAVSAALCAAGPGSVVGVRGPFGTGWEVDRSPGHDLLFVAGGIGLAPLRSALLEALGRRAHHGSVTVLAGAKTPAEHLYQDEDESWLADGALVLRTVDRLEPDPCTLQVPAWDGSVGLVTELLTGLRLHPEHTTAFVCGPEVMMTHTGSALTRLGIPPERIVVSLERNMRCGLGICGHCQLGPDFVCLDGPVTTLDHAEPLLAVPEL